MKPKRQQNIGRKTPIQAAIFDCVTGFAKHWRVSWGKAAKIAGNRTSALWHAAYVTHGVCCWRVGFVLCTRRIYLVERNRVYGQCHHYYRTACHVFSASNVYLRY